MPRDELEKDIGIVLGSRASEMMSRERIKEYGAATDCV